MAQSLEAFLVVSEEAELQRPSSRQVPAAFLALVAPDRGMEKQARVGSARPAFLIAFVCAAATALAQADRIDARAMTLRRLDQAGQLQTMSDRQVDDETKNAERLFQVQRVAAGVLEAPLFLGLGSLSVLGLVWFLRGRVKGRAVVPVAAAALLPSAIANVLDAIAALRQAAIQPGAAILAPRNLSGLAAALGHAFSGPWLKLGNAVDFFSLWAALLMGYGVAAAGEIPLRRALLGTLVGWVFYRLLTNVAVGG